MSTIGVDTGGTFTDLIYLRDDGGIEVAKRSIHTPSILERRHRRGGDH